VLILFVPNLCAVVKIVQIHNFSKLCCITAQFSAMYITVFFSLITNSKKVSHIPMNVINISNICKIVSDACVWF